MVPIYVRPGRYGFGAFAATSVEAGTVIWQDCGPEDPTVVRLSRESGLRIHENGLPVRKWATAEIDGTWLLAVDGSQFFNHRSDDSPEADTSTCPDCGCVYATRHIASGSELMCDYRVDDYAVHEKLDHSLATGRPRPSTHPCPICENKR